MNEDIMHEQAAAYALGALEHAEAREMETKLESNAELRGLVREYQEIAGLLAAGAGGHAPRAELKQMVLRRARGGDVIPMRRSWTMLAVAAAVTGLVAAAAATWQLVSANARLGRARAELSSVTARRDLLQRRLDAILDDNTSMYVMQPTAAGQAMARFGAQIFWRRDTQTWLVHVFDMPKLPANQVYQLWYLAGGAPISAGVLEMDEAGHAIAVLDVPAAARGATQAAISVEPGPEGSAQPTGTVVMAGSVTETR